MCTGNLTYQKLVFEAYNVKKGNLGDMRKIHLTRQFFETSGPQGHVFGKKMFACVLEPIAKPKLQDPFFSIAFGLKGIWFSPISQTPHNI